MPSEEYKEENMRQVLIAAMCCFEQYGVYTTTLKMIAKKSGLTIRSLSRYFGTKDNLIVKALAFYLDEYNSSAKSIYTAPQYLKLSGYEQIKYMLNQRTTYTIQHPGLTLCVADIESYLAHNQIGEELRPIYNDYMRFMKQVIKSALEKGLEDKTLSSTINIEQTIYFLYETFNCVLKRLPILYYNALTDQLEESKAYMECFVLSALGNLGSVNSQEKI